MGADRLVSEAIDKAEANRLISDAIDKAKHLATGPKNDDYGDPKVNHANIGVLLDAYLKIRSNPSEPITPEQSISIEILKKIARIEATPDHEDSWVDIIGYGACGYSVTMRREDGHHGTVRDGDGYRREEREQVVR